MSVWGNHLPDLTPDTRLALARAGIWFRDCPICGWAHVGGKGGQTAHMIYCSNACRQKAYRLRHGQRYSRPGRPKKQVVKPDFF